MHDKRLATDFLGCNSRSIGQPVVSMDHIIGCLLCDHGSNDGIPGNLFHQFDSVFPGELVAVRKYGLGFVGTFHRIL